MGRVQIAAAAPRVAQAGVDKPSRPTGRCPVGVRRTMGDERVGSSFGGAARVPVPRHLETQHGDGTKPGGFAVAAVPKTITPAVVVFRHQIGLFDPIGPKRRPIVDPDGCIQGGVGKFVGAAFVQGRVVPRARRHKCSYAACPTFQGVGERVGRGGTGHGGCFVGRRRQDGAAMKRTRSFGRAGDGAASRTFVPHTHAMEHGKRGVVKDHAGTDDIARDVVPFEPHAPPHGHTIGVVPTMAFPNLAQGLSDGRAAPGGQDVVRVLAARFVPVAHVLDVAPRIEVTGVHIDAHGCQRGVLGGQVVRHARGVVGTVCGTLTFGEHVSRRGFSVVCGHLLALPARGLRGGGKRDGVPVGTRRVAAAVVDADGRHPMADQRQPAAGPAHVRCAKFGPVQETRASGRVRDGMGPVVVEPRNFAARIAVGRTPVQTRLEGDAAQTVGR